MEYIKCCKKGIANNNINYSIKLYMFFKIEYLTLIHVFDLKKIKHHLEEADELSDRIVLNYLLYFAFQFSYIFRINLGNNGKRKIVDLRNLLIH